MKTLLSQGVSHTIYESSEVDIVPNKSSIKDAYTGCYIQSEEGYWVPVIRHNCSKQTVYLRLPRKQITNRTRSFSYIPERMSVDKITLNAKQRAVAELMISGVKFPMAVKSVYIDYKKGVKAIIHCENFFIYVGKAFMGLKEQLLQKGMDEEFLATQIHDIIAGEKRQSPIIKLWALNKLSDTLAEVDKAPEVKQLERAVEQNNFLQQIKEESTSQPMLPVVSLVSPEESTSGDSLDYDLTDLLSS